MPGDRRPQDRADAVVALLRQDPATTVLAFDFDGTLSPMVAVPADARPAAGVVELLDELAATHLRVAVLSGRPVAFLAEHLPASVQLVGLYGLERRLDGVVSDHPEAPRWRPVVARAAARAGVAAEPDGPLAGVLVEAKGLSLTLHVRTHPELAATAEQVARRLASEGGLEVRAAKQSFELHPPVSVDKGEALLELARDASTVLFVGDDLGDLPAFDALDALRSPRCRTVGVVVGGSELPTELRDRGHLTLPGQSAVLDLLRALRPAAHDLAGS
jgi:trehalose 6-phosphate phosphatase